VRSARNTSLIGASNGRAADDLIVSGEAMIEAVIAAVVVLVVLTRR
jgi:hypothetical protein